MTSVTLPAIPPGIIIDQLLPGPERIILVGHAVATSVACPLCGMPSSHLHSRYRRRLADLPWHGRVVELHVTVRRLRCTAAGCRRRVFAEPLTGVTTPRLRRTLRLRSTQQHIGLALGGGEPCARLSHKLAMPVSGDTLLRLIRAADREPPPVPRVLGIDEWAWRKRLRYGTILVDLERGTIVDLLAERDANQVAAWLQEHPGVEIIARDRGGIYANAAAAGAPQARQVADRWHLWHNLTEALAVVLEHHRGAITTACSGAAAAAAEPPPPGPALARLRAARRDERTRCFAEMQRLHAQGLGSQAIAREVGVSCRTVERWLAAGAAPAHIRPRRSSLLDAYQPNLERRLGEGCRNATRLFHELQAQGYAGSFQTVARWLAPRRAVPPKSAKTTPAMARPPSRRRIAWLLSQPVDKLRPAEAAFITRLCAAAPALASAADLARRFAALLQDKDPSRLDDWLQQAETSELASFAAGIRRDRVAVEAAVTEPWSTGPVEGHINKLKVVKRTMYGRAHHDLLRQRVLAA